MLSDIPGKQHNILAIAHNHIDEKACQCQENGLLKPKACLQCHMPAHGHESHKTQYTCHAAIPSKEALGHQVALRPSSAAAEHRERAFQLLRISRQ